MKLQSYSWKFKHTFFAIFFLVIIVITPELDILPFLVDQWSRKIFNLFKKVREDAMVMRHVCGQTLKITVKNLLAPP